MSPLCTGIHCWVNVQRQRKDALKDFKAAIKDSFVSFGAPRRVNKNKIIVNKQEKNPCSYLKYIVILCYSFTFDSMKNVAFSNCITFPALGGFF